MIRINLLEQRKPAAQGAAKSGGRGASFKVGAAGSGLLAAAIVLGCVGFIGYKWYTISNQIKELTAANTRADQEIKELDKALKTIDQYQAKKNILEQRVSVISDLKRRQSVPVHLLDQISKQLPEFLWLDGMDEKANTLNVKGKATTYNAVSNFYNNLKESPFFSNVSMEITQSAPEGVSFAMSFSFVPPQAQEADKAGTVNGVNPGSAPALPATPTKG